MGEIENLDQNLDLEKPLSKLSVISESHETHKALIKWPVSKADIEKNLSSVGGYISSNWFYVGSHSYYLTLYPNGREAALKGFVSVTIKFNDKLPENVWIEGEISIKGKEMSKKFSAGSFTSQKDIDTFDETKNLKRYIAKDDIVIHCSIKMKLQEVKCEFDDKTVHCKQSRKFNPCEDTLFQNERFSDVTFHLRGGELLAHKAKLIKIPYFLKMFRDDYSHFDLMHIKYDIFKQVLQYLYNNDIPELNFRLACELYTVANEFEFFDLKNVCSSYLGVSLTVKNVFIVFKLASKCDDIPLKKECIQFIKNSNTEKLATDSLVI